MMSYKMIDVQIHNKENDCWVVINDKVYNITPYLQSNSHPGGDYILFKYCGKDVTTNFIDIHSDEALKKLDQYLIGTLNDNSYLNILKNMLWY